MTDQLAYTLVAASVGFVAAIFFGYGAALLRQRSIVLLATTYWGFNEEQATAIVAQSAQYLVGGLMLVVSFVLQVLAATTSNATSLQVPQIITNPYCFSLLSIVTAGLIGWVCYQAILRWRLPQVLLALKKSSE